LWWKCSTHIFHTVLSFSKHSWWLLAFFMWYIQWWPDSYIT